MTTRQMQNVGDVEAEDLGNGRTVLYVPGEPLKDEAGEPILGEPVPVYAIAIPTDKLEEVLAGGWPSLHCYVGPQP